MYVGLILRLHPDNERRRYKVTPSLIGWAQTPRISPVYIMMLSYIVCVEGDSYRRWSQIRPHCYFPRKYRVVKPTIKHGEWLPLRNCGTVSNSFGTGQGNAMIIYMTSLSSIYIHIILSLCKNYQLPMCQLLQLSAVMSLTKWCQSPPF